MSDSLGDIGLSSEDYKRFRSHTDFYVKSIAMTLLLPDSVTSGRRLCGPSLARSMQQLFNQGWTEDDFLKHCPIFVNALILFTISITDDRLRDLKQRLSSCHCYSSFPKPPDGPLPDMQALHHDFAVDPMLQVCNQLFAHLIRFLIGTTGAPAVSPEKVANGQRVVPAEFKTVIHYMTNKAADVLAACCCWQKLCKSRVVIGYMLACITRWPKAFRPVFRSAKGQEMLSLSVSEFKRIVDELHCGATAITDDIAHSIAAHVMFIYEFIKWFPSAFQHRSGPLLNGIATTFHDILHGLPAAQQTYLQSQGVPSKLCQITLMTFPTHLLSDLGLAMKWIEKLVVHGGPEAKTAKLCRGHHMMCFRVWADLSGATTISECFNPDCAKLPEQHRFPQCARCRIVAYCSKECQAQAWTLPGCPHKELCTDWARLKRCWPNMWEYINSDDDLTADEHEERLKHLALQLGYTESRLKVLDDNYHALGDMRVARYTAIVYGDAGQSTTSQ